MLLFLLQHCVFEECVLLQEETHPRSNLQIVSDDEVRRNSAWQDLVAIEKFPLLKESRFRAKVDKFPYTLDKTLFKLILQKQNKKKKTFSYRNLLLLPALLAYFINLLLLFFKYLLLIFFHDSSCSRCKGFLFS